MTGRVRMRFCNTRKEGVYMRKMRVWLGLLSMCAVMTVPMTSNAEELKPSLKTMESVKENQLKSDNTKSTEIG